LGRSEGAPDAERSTRTASSEDSEDLGSNGSEDFDSEGSGGGREPPPHVTAEMLLRDEAMGKASRAEAARLEAENEADRAEKMLEKAHEVRGSDDLREVFTKYELTESHGVNRPNLAECIKRVKLQIAKDGCLSLERSADLDLLKTAMHPALL
jgi:hypothetical protein